MYFRLLRNESGGILIFAAVMTTVLIGVLALAIDGSYMYEQRNRLAAAADAAAKAGAQELTRNSSVSVATLQAFAENEVALNGFTPGGATTVVVNHPPKNGPFTGLPDYVETIVSRQTSTFFGGVLGFLSMTPTARAVAGKGSSSPCVIALGANPVSAGPYPTAPSLGANAQAIRLDGNAALGGTGCSVKANANLFVGANGSVTATPVALAGTCSGAHCPTVGMTTGQPIESDPLRTLQFPSDPGTCAPLNLSGNSPFTTTVSLGWRCYSNIDIGGNVDATFVAGNYYVKGDIEIGLNATLTGSGVTIFMTGTASGLHVGGNARLTLSAPTSGPWAGIGFYQDRSDFTAAVFDANTVLTLAGALYIPTASVTLGGNGRTSSDCAIIVAHQLTLTGNAGSLQNACTAYGGSLLSAGSAVAE